jgi:hypothetical protein
MTKQEIREILASGGLSLLFTPKRQPTTEGGDASCPEQSTPPAACSSAPSPTGGGAEEELRKVDTVLGQLSEEDWQTVYAAARRSLKGEQQPDWQALAGELADLLARVQPYVQASERSYARWLADASSKAVDRFHEAVAQHSGEGS